ncbi:DUF6153 family protein [Solwaraspora sp. WMMD791]|uniref:DUF6153 family protein n=1 Tax=Solwaraspora sp. WMMD791 TaxID=3016086 RepID=UPI00249B90F4|nr:DUF6153 family protein [Solwaraspora sp. WMMD791]WFE27002.1 DUF6153 family protein [Solwaraspora sp. WMMD791]
MSTTVRWHVRRVRQRGPVSTLAWLRPLAVLAVLTGLVFMHQLVGGSTTSGHDHADHPSAPNGYAAAADEHVGPEPNAGRVSHCPLEDDGCPAPAPGHPDHTCQLTAPGPPAVVTPPPRAAAPGEPTPAVPLASPWTAAHDAARGTGCGPPTLAELSIWRI